MRPLFDTGVANSAYARRCFTIGYWLGVGSGALFAAILIILVKL